MDRYLDGSNVQDRNVSVSTSVGGSEDADARDTGTRCHKPRVSRA